MALLLKSILFTILAPGTVAVLIPLWMAPDGPAGMHLGRLAGIFLLISGVTVCLWCVWDFAAHGRGTPAPIDAPKELVTRGLYRYIRNPMYVGVLTTIFAWALFFASFRIFIYGVTVGVLFHFVVILYEEPTLKRQFGESYLRYFEAVGRWVPRARFLGRR